MGKKQARIDELEHELEVANSKANQHWLSLKSALHGIDLAVRRLEAEKAKKKPADVWDLALKRGYEGRIAELERELGDERLKAALTPPRVNLGDPADKKIIENQKQTILELLKQVDALADQRNNAIDRAEKAESKVDVLDSIELDKFRAFMHSRGFTAPHGLFDSFDLHRDKSIKSDATIKKLQDELAELKAKQSPFALAIPESYKLKAKDQEIRSLNLYITRLTSQLDNIRLAAR